MQIKTDLFITNVTWTANILSACWCLNADADKWRHFTYDYNLWLHNEMILALSSSSLFLFPAAKKKQKTSQRWSVTRGLPRRLICLVSNGNLMECVWGIQGSGGIAMTSDFGRLSCSAATVIIVQESLSGSAALTFKTKCFWSCDLLFSSRSLRGQRVTPVWNQQPLISEGNASEVKRNTWNLVNSREGRTERKGKKSALNPDRKIN